MLEVDEQLLRLALCVCLVLGGCNELVDPGDLGQEILDATVDGKTVPCSQRVKFTLILDSWADAGYSWDCEISDTLIVGMFGQPTYKPTGYDPDVDGGPSAAIFTFITKRPGLCQVRLVEHQRWMVGVAPRNSITFSVAVFRSDTAD